MKEVIVYIPDVGEPQVFTSIEGVAKGTGIANRNAIAAGLYANGVYIRRKQRVYRCVVNKIKGTGNRNINNNR